MGMNIPLANIGRSGYIHILGHLKVVNRLDDN